jgi:hypothetical protein
MQKCNVNRLEGVIYLCQEKMVGNETDDTRDDPEEGAGLVAVTMICYKAQ